MSGSSDLHRDSIDVASAIDRLGGNRELFARLLAKFVASFRDADARIGASIASSDLAAASHITHALKGTSANLSLKEVAAVSGAIESALRAGDAVGAARLLERLSIALVAVEKAARKWTASE